MENEWQVATLGELTENYDSLRIPVKRADRRPGPYPYYGASGIIDYIDEYIFNGEYLLIAEDGENLRSRTTPIAFMANGKFWVNNHAHIVRGNKKADTRFLMYTLRATNISGYLSGTTVPKLNQDNLNRIALSIPSLKIQRAIAHILGTLDDKIELNRRMNETLEAIARAIFKSWFVDFDPVRAKMEGRDPGLPPHIADLFPDRLVDSELGEMPEGWEIYSLDEIANYQNGLALQKYPAEEGNDFLHRLKIRELRQGYFDDRSEKSTIDIPDEFIAYDGDVIFSWSGSLLIDLWTGGKGALNQHLFKVTSEEYPKWFYYYWTKHHLDEFQRIAAGKATTMGHIKRNHLSEAMVIAPKREFLEKFQDNIEPFIRLIINRRLEIQTLSNLRDTILPKLISGELRVDDPQAFLERVS